MPKSRIFLFLLLAFIGGVFVRSFFSFSLVFVWVVFICAAFCIALGILKKIRRAVFYGFIVIAFLGGVARFSYEESIKPDMSLLYGMHASYRGIVRDEPYVSEKAQKLKIKILERDGFVLQQPFFALATVGRYPRYTLGDELKILDALEKPVNFSEFDYVSYLARDNIFGVFLFPEVVKIGEQKGSRIKMFLARVRRSFEENIDNAIPEPHAAFLKGLLLGERESLPEELVSNFSRTGTTHVIALSGYNITLVAQFFIAFLLFLTLPFHIAFFFASSAIVLFVILVGASPSVTRAGLMGILVLIAQKEGRMYSIRNALAFAGAAMIFENPYILRFDAAFQLSFLATLGLVYLSPRVEFFLENMWRRVRWVITGQRVFIKRAKNPHTMNFTESALSRIKTTFVETLSAQLTVLPLLMYLFGRVSLVSPLANLFVILAVPYSMALGFFTGGIGFFSPRLGVLAGSVNWLFLEYKIRVIELFSRVPHASISIMPISGIFVFLFYAVLLYLLFRKQA